MEVATTTVADNGGTAPAQVVVKGFEHLSNIGVIEESANATADPVVKTEGDAPPALITDTKDTGNAASEDKSDPAKEEVITELKFDDEGVNPTEPNPEEKAKAEALAKLEADQSWMALAKVRGVEITEDSFEAYNKALDEKFVADTTLKVEEAKKEARELELSKLPVEAVVIIEGVKEGFSIEEILEPKREIQKLKALSDADLIAKDCELKGWPQNIIDKHIADLTEADKLDVTAQPLRDILNANEETIAKRQLEQITQLKQSRAATELKVRKDEAVEIKNTLTSMKTFLDLPIHDSVVNRVMQKWENNEYQEAFKDPKVVAEFLMYKEFGEKGVKSLKQREYERGRDEKASKLHNIPPLGNVGGKHTSTGAVKAEGNFGALPGNK